MIGRLKTSEPGANQEIMKRGARNVQEHWLEANIYSFLPDFYAIFTKQGRRGKNPRTPSLMNPQLLVGYIVVFRMLSPKLNFRKSEF